MKSRAKRRFYDLVKDKAFTFAKTMPDNPHYYTLRSYWKSTSEFDEAVRIIRDNGSPEEYKNRLYIVLHVNDYAYWTMGAPIEQTTLINRKRHAPDNPYDLIADRYDLLYQTEQARAEDVQLFGLLKALENEDILDVGCGTGLTLDYLQPRAYTGIDASKLMIERARAKHPNRRFLHALAENYVEDCTAVIALYGSASYIKPSTVERLTRDRLYWLMYYEKDYTPLSHKAIREVSHAIITLYEPVHHVNKTLFGKYRVVTNLP